MGPAQQCILDISAEQLLGPQHPGGKGVSARVGGLCRVGKNVNELDETHIEVSGFEESENM